MPIPNVPKPAGHVPPPPTRQTNHVQCGWKLCPKHFHQIKPGYLEDGWSYGEVATKIRGESKIAMRKFVLCPDHTATLDKSCLKTSDEAKRIAEETMRRENQSSDTKPPTEQSQSPSETPSEQPPSDEAAKGEN